MRSFLEFIVEETHRVKWTYHPKHGVNSGRSDSTHPLEHADLTRDYDDSHKGNAFVKNKIAHTWWQFDRTPHVMHTMDFNKVEKHLKSKYRVNDVIWHANGIKAQNALKTH